MTWKWSASGAAKRKFCSTISTVKPCDFKVRIMRPSACTMTGARPSEISSSSSTSAPVRRMRATASICCSPPDSRVPWLARRSARLGNIS